MSDMYSRPPFDHPVEDCNEIFESPKELPEIRFWAADAGRNKGRLAQLKADPSFKEVGKFNETPIYSSGNYFFATYPDKDRGEMVSFMVQWVEHPFPTERGAAVVQIALWRDRWFDHAQKGISEHVFWTHIYPKRHAVMTDSGQTEHGKHFWHKRAAEALDRGVPLYLLNLAKVTARRIKSADAYHEAIATAYGSDDRHRDLRLLITDRPLPGFQVTERQKSVILL